MEEDSFNQNTENSDLDTDKKSLYSNVQKDDVIVDNNNNDNSENDDVNNNNKQDGGQMDDNNNVEHDDNNNVPMADLNLQQGKQSDENGNVAKSEKEAEGDESDEVGGEEMNNKEDNDQDDVIEKPSSADSGRPASAPKSIKNEDETEDGKAPQNETGEIQISRENSGDASTFKVKSVTRKLTTTPVDDSGLAQPILPVIPRGQAKVQQIASSISEAKKRDPKQPTIYPTRNRVPPKLIRLATVTVSPAKARPIHVGTSLYYEEPRRPQKVITLDQAQNSRPPLRIDMEGPGPCSYSPLNKPLNETNAPSYSFGMKCYPEKPEGIGSRTSWAKSWFQSNHPYHYKADYVREGLWPSPTHYPKPVSLGARQKTMYQAPSYTFGHKQELSFIKPGACKEPSPTDYERQNADGQILRRAPSFSHQFRREGTVLWGNPEVNPGPAAYTPSLNQSQRLQKPSYTISGIRRSKSHLLGPFSSI